MRQRVWLAPALVFVGALAVYGATAPPGLTWAHNSADGGDLAAAALSGGVPHPSGYPTYILAARLFSRLPWHTPAWRLTLLSMLAGASAAALVSASVLRLVAAYGASSTTISLPAQTNDEDTVKRKTNRRASLVSSLLVLAPALLAGLALAFSPLLWGQATVIEVYALHAFLAALVIWSIMSWHTTGKPGWVALSGATFGLALGNHLTTIWLVPCVVAGLILPAAPRVAQAKVLVQFALAMALGLLIYLILPLAAAAQPPVNWGNPRTVSGFWWLVSGKLYYPFVLAVRGPEALGRLANWSGMMWREFLPWGVVLALAGLGWLWQASRLLAFGLLFSLVLGVVWAASYNTSDSLLTLLPGWVIISLWIGLGAAWVLDALRRRSVFAAVAAGLLGLLLLCVPLGANWKQQDLSADRSAENYLAGLLQIADPNAVILTVGDRATFALWYARYGLEQREDVIPIARDLWGMESYRQTVGAAHPLLVGNNPPSELATLLSAGLDQGRPVYMTRVGEMLPEPQAPAALAGSTIRWLPVRTTALSGGLNWGLWRLEQTP